jgi:hypothetical protein
MLTIAKVPVRDAFLDAYFKAGDGVTDEAINAKVDAGCDAVSRLAVAHYRRPLIKASWRLALMTLILLLLMAYDFAVQAWGQFGVAATLFLFVSWCWFDIDIAARSIAGVR